MNMENGKTTRFSFEDAECPETMEELNKVFDEAKFEEFNMHIYGLSKEQAMFVGRAVYECGKKFLGNDGSVDPMILEYQLVAVGEVPR
jgi:hypothetical protein